MTFRRAACAALVSGCVCACSPYDSFLVEMRPVEDAMERRLTGWRVNGDDNKANKEELYETQLQVLAKLYPQHEKAAAGPEHVFTGRFKDAAPPDVGGFGSFPKWTSPLGTAYAYTERFRGRDDLWAVVEEKHKAADRFTDILIAWFAREMCSDPRFGPLRKFMDTDLRRDLHNLGMYAWAAEVAGRVKNDSGVEFGVRAAQYLQERGYVAIADAPAIERAIETADGEALVTLLRNFVMRKIGPAAEGAGHTPAFLAGRAALEASWRAYLKATPEYADRLKQWEAEKKENADAKKPEPENVTAHLLDQLVGLDIFPTTDAVEIRLACEVKPITNGTWDEKTRRITWSERIQHKDSPPAFCYAFWSVPDRKFQADRFGKVILKGEKLWNYTLWRVGLTPDEARQWDALVAELKPGDALAEKIGAFKLTGSGETVPEPEGNNADRLARRGRTLLLDALKAAGAPAAEGQKAE